MVHDSYAEIITRRVVKMLNKCNEVDAHLYHTYVHMRFAGACAEGLLCGRCTSHTLYLHEVGLHVDALSLPDP